MFNILMRILQSLALIAVFVLEYFSKRKMGVERYLAYKNMKFREGIFLDSNLKIYTILLTMLLIVAVVLLIFNLRKVKYNNVRFNLVMVIIFSLCLILLVFFKEVITFKSYYFLIIGVFVMLCVEVLNTIIRVIKKK